MTFDELIAKAREIGGKLKEDFRNDPQKYLLPAAGAGTGAATAWATSDDSNSGNLGRYLLYSGLGGLGGYGLDALLKGSDVTEDPHDRASGRTSKELATLTGASEGSGTGHGWRTADTEELYGKGTQEAVNKVETALEKVDPELNSTVLIPKYPVSSFIGPDAADQTRKDVGRAVNRHVGADWGAYWDPTVNAEYRQLVADPEKPPTVAVMDALREDPHMFPDTTIGGALASQVSQWVGDNFEIPEIRDIAPAAPIPPKGYSVETTPSEERLRQVTGGSLMSRIAKNGVFHTLREYLTGVPAEFRQLPLDKREEIEKAIIRSNYSPTVYTVEKSRPTFKPSPGSNTWSYFSNR